MLGVTQPRHLGRRSRQRRSCLLMRRGQAGPVLILSAKVILQVPVLLLGLLGAGPGLFQRTGKAARLLLGRGQPAACRAGLAAQPGQPLGTLGGGPGVGGQLALGLGQRRLGRGPRRDGRRQVLARQIQPVTQRRLLLAQRGRFPFKLIRIPARTSRRGGADRCRCRSAARSATARKRSASPPSAK